MLSLPKVKEKKKKKALPSAAATAKVPGVRAKELVEKFEGDRKKVAYSMEEEGYNRPEVEVGFKEATGKGIGGKMWGIWKREDAETDKLMAETAGSVAARREQALETVTLATYKNLTKQIQDEIIDLGCYVVASVAPQVPGTPEEKISKTKTWLSDAVTSFQPEKMEEIEKFGATAFLAALELKRQMRVFMDWAEPSKRLENLAEKALYSPNPLNMEAFQLLLTELMRTIHAVPKFERGPRLEELPGIVKAYASARDITLEEAEKRMQAVIGEVA